MIYLQKLIKTKNSWLFEKRSTVKQSKMNQTSDLASSRFLLKTKVPLMTPGQIRSTVCSLLGFMTIFIFNVYSQEFEISDSILYVSSYNEIKFGDKISHGPEIAFKTEGNLMVTTLEDQMSRIRMYRIKSKGDDSDFNWKTFYSIDNSGTKMYLTFGHEKISNSDIVLLDYGSAYWYFEVKKYPIPPEAYFILDNIESLGYLGDGRDANTYTDEEVKQFLSQFGDPNMLMNVMILSQFTVYEFINLAILGKVLQMAKREQNRSQ
jgi:hypothetical protein